MPVWSEQETMIAESAAAFFASRGAIARVRRHRDSGADFDTATWQDAAAQGWLGMLVPEASGGLGLGLRDALALMREAARTVPAEPFADIIALAGGLTDISSAKDLLARMMSGDSVIVPVRLSVSGSSDNVTGLSAPAAGVGSAHGFVLLCSGGKDGHRLMLVEKNTPGVSAHASPTHDGGNIGRVELDNVFAKCLASGQEAVRLIQTIDDTRLLLHAAELVGLADEARQRTLVYLETRKQFGVALSSFQSLQHRVASLHVQVAAADALQVEAARAFGGDRQSFAAQAAFHRAGTAARLATKEAIQLHGAIGFTDELEIGFFLKRAMALTAAEGGLEAITLMPA
jgi:alkylation response protein AidB-like acyl-CoA dehydrogenase